MEPAPEPEEDEPDAQEPEDEGAAEAADPEVHATLLLSALASCPFGRDGGGPQHLDLLPPRRRREQPAQRGAAFDAGSPHLRRTPPEAAATLSPKASRELEESAALAIRGAAALAKRGRGSTRWSAALASTGGLGSAARGWRTRAAAGDAQAAAVVRDLDFVQGGRASPEGYAQVRRLEMALALPEGCPARRELLEERARQGRRACAAQVVGEPEHEDRCEQLRLLMSAESQLSLQEALEAGDVEL